MCVCIHRVLFCRSAVSLLKINQTTYNVQTSIHSTIIKPNIINYFPVRNVTFIINKTSQFFYPIHMEGQIQNINGFLITLFIYSALELKKDIKN